MQHDINPDEHGPLGLAMADAVNTCVHCGFCLPACPTYQELGQETDSPRGRIFLMKEVLEGSMELDDALPHLDTCLGCLACEPACPSGVQYHALISPFRATSEPKRSRGIADRFRRLITQLTLPYPSRFRLAAKTGGLAKSFSALIPSSLRVMLDLLPDKIPSSETWKPINQAVGKQRARVALLTGCAQSVLDPDINTATIEVLTQNGVEVVIPESQGCCGALSWHIGNQKQAAQFAKHNIQAFPNDVDAVITNAAGCGSGMQEYHLMLQGTPDQATAETFRHKVKDVSAFLIDLGDLKPIADLAQPIKVAYHDACHLSNAQGIRQQPRELLRSVPGIELLEIPDGDFCCGSAGTYNIDQPTIADSLGRQKADNVVSTGASVVATGNIGCMTQLKTHLGKLDSPILVRHTMQVLRDAYSGELR